MICLPLLTQTGQHCPSGTWDDWPSRHNRLAHNTVEQSSFSFGWHLAQHSPGGVTNVSPSSQSSSVKARHSTAEQSGRMHTGQHWPGGVSITPPSLHGGRAQNTVEQSSIGRHLGQHSPGRVTIFPSHSSTARHSTAAQSGRVHTGQHSPGGVSGTSPSWHRGHETAEQSGLMGIQVVGQHWPLCTAWGICPSGHSIATQSTRLQSISLPVHGGKKEKY